MTNNNNNDMRTPEEQVALKYVKAAKNFSYNDDDIENSEKNYEEAIKIAPKFSYAIEEFSRFEFNRGCISRALELGREAIKVNPENYHAWLNYGNLLKRNNQLKEAIECLKKAKELNPNHLPIYKALGRVFTFIGDYESAEREFQEALREEEFPTIDHKVITLQFMAENFHRFADSFRITKDIEGEIEKLKLASDTILKAAEIGKNDKKLWSIYRSICRDLGLALSNKDGFSEGRPYLEKCLETINLGKKSILPDNKIIVEACFYLAAINMNENYQDFKQIESWINIGVENCENDSKWIDKFNDLKNQIKMDKVSAVDRKHGCIKYFNTLRQFGVIEISNQTYLFFPSCFRQMINIEQLSLLKGRIVSCILVNNQEKKDTLIADDIIFDETPAKRIWDKNIKFDLAIKNLRLQVAGLQH